MDVMTKFLFIYVDDIRDVVKWQLEKHNGEVSPSQVEEILKKIKFLHGPENPIPGNPRLGILTLASVLREKFGSAFDIHYCDMAFECLEPEDLRSRLKKLQPEM